MVTKFATLSFSLKNKRHCLNRPLVMLNSVIFLDLYILKSFYYINN